MSVLHCDCSSFLIFGFYSISREEHGYTVADIDVASLNLVDTFDAATLIARLQNGLTEATKDEDIGGFSVHKNVTETVIVQEPPQLGATAHNNT